MMRTLLFNLFFILCSLLYAQSTLITGKIMVDDADEVMDLSGATVENLMTKAKAKANSEGLFSINVNLDDELYIKHLGIQDRSLKVTEAMMTKGFVSIHMNVEVIELAETNIQKLNKDAFRNMGKEKSFQEKLGDEMGINSLDFKAELNLKHDEEIVNRTIKQVGGVNLLGIMNLFKNPKKRVKNSVPLKIVKEDQLLALRRFYTTYYFINDLKIPEGNILDFIHYCYVEFKLESHLKRNNYDEVLLVLEEQAPIYLAKISKNE
ncbi:hypothetical protein OBK14_02625 [Empedobacter falsenii]